MGIELVYKPSVLLGGVYTNSADRDQAYQSPLFAYRILFLSLIKLKKTSNGNGLAQLVSL